MNTKPFVSVIIPVYNAELYLRECLDSLINQTLTDIEIICVDDGSTDNSPNILAEYEAKDGRVQVLHQKNLYAGVARNNGMTHAKGDYMLFLDADDFFEASMLERLYSVAEENNADIVICNADRFDNRERQYLPMPWLLRNEYLPPKKVFNSHDIPLHIFQITIAVPWNKLFRSEFVKRTGVSFQNTPRANDIYFTGMTTILAERITVVDEELIHYRVNTGTNLQSGNNKTPTAFLPGLIGIKQDLVKMGFYNEFKRSFINRVMSTSMYTFMTLEKDLQAYQVLFKIMQEVYLNEFELLNKPESYFYDTEYYRSFTKYLDKIAQAKMIEDTRNKVKFSVIIPIFNAEQYLRECLDSVANQTVTDIEVICVDDGSTDGTALILDEYAEKDKRFRIIHQKNQYAGVARNNGISQANGDYIVFLDSDDVLADNALESYYKAVFFSDADVIVSETYSFNKNLCAARKQPSWLKHDYIPECDFFEAKEIFLFIFNFTTGAPGGKCFRREFVIRNSLTFLPIQKSEDFYFVHLGLAKARTIAIVRKPIYYKRDVANSLENRKHEMPLLFWDAVLLFKKRLEEDGLFETVKQSFINECVKKFAYNLQSVKTDEAREIILKKLYSVYEAELGIGVFPQKYYYNQSNYCYLCKLLSIRMNGQKQEEQRLEADLIRQSLSYKIGRFITYIPRKVRGGIRCYRENGLGYTMRRVKEKITDLFGGR